MFLKSLRDLQITKKGDSVEINYKCKKCDERVQVEITIGEYIELKNGLPFSSVFGKNLQYFKSGKCENCYEYRSS